MLTRILTAIVALAVLIGVLIAPPVVFTIALAAVILIMLHECYNAISADKGTRAIGVLLAVYAAVLMIYSVRVTHEHEFVVMMNVIYMIPAIVIFMLLHMGMLIVKHGKIKFSEILAGGFLTLYVLISMMCLWLTKEVLTTADMILIFICAWSTDTFAYFTGYFLGKHKLIPHVSPKKTVEGAIGGVIGSILISIAYLAVTKNIMNIDDMEIWHNIYVHGAVIGLVGGICSQLGDLAASAIKRDTGIKDFGHIFPGHGGFMDRFDSVMFIAPVMFMVMFVMAVIF